MISGNWTHTLLWSWTIVFQQNNWFTAATTKTATVTVFGLFWQAAEHPFLINSPQQLREVSELISLMSITIREVILNWVGLHLYGGYSNKIIERTALLKFSASFNIYSKFQVVLADFLAFVEGAVWRVETWPKMQQEACENHNQELQVHLRSCGKYCNTLQSTCTYKCPLLN